MDAQDVSVFQNSIEYILVPVDRKICATKRALDVRIETDQPGRANSVACRVAQAASKRLNHVEHGEESVPGALTHRRLMFIRLDIDSQDRGDRSKRRHKVSCLGKRSQNGATVVPPQAFTSKGYAKLHCADVIKGRTPYAREKNVNSPLFESAHVRASRILDGLLNLHANKRSKHDKKIICNQPVVGSNPTAGSSLRFNVGWSILLSLIAEERRDQRSILWQERRC